MPTHRCRWVGIPLVLLFASLGTAHGGELDPSLEELRARTRDFSRTIAFSSDSVDGLIDPTAPTPPRNAQQDYLAVAENLYRRGDYAQASEQLQPLIANRRQVQEPAVIDLYLRILLARGRSPEAADWVLRQRNAKIHTPYIRFNLAVALMRSGRAEEAVTALYRLGTMSANDDETFAIRDQANLALGWYFLGRGLGINAKESFRRVRLRGPQANRALLGMGWSELAPQDARSYREYVGDEASAFDTREFSPSLATSGAERRTAGPDLSYLAESIALPDYPSGKLSPPERLALARAIHLWQELQQRSRNDPFVWESWVAVPYALEKAAVYDQTTENYRQAITRLEALEAMMNADAARVTELARECLALLREQPMSDGSAFVLPVEAEDHAWMGEWLAGNPAQVILGDLAETRSSLAIIAELESALPGSLADTDPHVTEAATLRRLWAAYAEDREREFERLLHAQIELRRQLLRRYRQSAHFALARLLDVEMLDVEAQLPQAAPAPAAAETFWERLNLFGRKPHR